MDRRIVLVGLGTAAVAVAIVGVGLVLGVEPRASDPRSSEPTPDPRIDPTIDPTIVARERPHLAESGQGGGAEGSETVTERARVRDHRPGDRVAYDPDARTGERRTAQRLPPELVQTLSKQLEAAIVECTAALPAEARGPRPGVGGSVFVDVANGSLQVTETAIELRDLGGDTAATTQCLNTRWLGQTVPAADAVAATHYEISVVFAVRSR